MLTKNTGRRSRRKVQLGMSLTEIIWIILISAGCMMGYAILMLLLRKYLSIGFDYFFN
jgi:hypothetical protein